MKMQYLTQYLLITLLKKSTVQCHSSKFSGLRVASSSADVYKAVHRQQVVDSQAVGRPSPLLLKDSGGSQRTGADLGGFRGGGTRCVRGGRLVVPFVGASEHSGEDVVSLGYLM